MDKIKLIPYEDFMDLSKYSHYFLFDINDMRPMSLKLIKTLSTSREIFEIEHLEMYINKTPTFAFLDDVNETLVVEFIYMMDDKF